MPNIFKVKTHGGYVVKILNDLLQNNIKTACFNINCKGIKLRMMDPQQIVLLDLELEADCFAVYIFKGQEPLSIGINLSHLHKMLKPTKKKDSLQLFIDDTSPNDLGIKLIPNENNRVTTSFVKIHNMQNIDIDLPIGYSKPVLIPSGEFQKMCKGLTHISNLTHITSKGFLVRFSSDAGGVMKRYTDFGETEDSEDEDSKIDESTEYTEDFDTEQLTRISKLAGLSKTIQIYTKKDNPLLFRSSVGNLGKISIYLKSKKLQEEESRSIQNEDDD